MRGAHQSLLVAVVVRCSGSYTCRCCGGKETAGSSQFAACKWVGSIDLDDWGSGGAANKCIAYRPLSYLEGSAVVSGGGGGCADVDATVVISIIWNDVSVRDVCEGKKKTRGRICIRGMGNGPKVG